MTAEITPAVERAAAAYLHMVPHCDRCAKESKGLLRRCTACKNLAVEFALHMLAAALDVGEMAQALFAWNTPQNPYFVLQGRPNGSDEPGQEEDPYLPIARATRTALLGADS